MNEQDEIIEMARQAEIIYRENVDEVHSFLTDGVYLEDLEAFAKLVAAKEREIQGEAFMQLLEAVRRNERAEEREACEALYEHEDVLAPVGASAWGEAYQEGWIAGAQAYRDAIKARGENK